jgi:transposase
MRRSIDGLAQAVVDSLDRQPITGEVFVFGNRARDKVKLLWYDRNGFWLAYKRLERICPAAPTLKSSLFNARIRESLFTGLPKMWQQRIDVFDFG